MTFKESKKAIQALDGCANSEGIVDVREAAYMNGYSDMDLIELAKRIGYRFVSQWEVNTKIIDV